MQGNPYGAAPAAAAAAAGGRPGAAAAAGYPQQPAYAYQQQAAAPAAQAAPAQPVQQGLRTTQEIQDLLDMNEALIKSIVETQAQGRAEEAQQYLQKLQANLMYLASVADAQNANLYLKQAEQQTAGQGQG